MYEAARLYDPIEHTQAAMGFILGAIVGAVFIAVASAALVIFGCGFFLGLFMGFLIGKIGLGILEVGEAEGRKHTVVTGKITEGSHNVFTNSRKAAIVERSTATCEKHPPVTRVAEGSTNIFINSKAAARKGDRTQCDAKISDGSDNVFLGGGAKAYLPITPEVPDSWRISTGWLFMAAGFLGGLGAALSKMSISTWRCVLKFSAGYFAGFVATNAAISYAAGLFGFPVDVTDGRKVLLPDDETDFVLPGRLPIVCQRFYSSALERQGMLGGGWRMPWELTLQETENGLIYTDRQGREHHSQPLNLGQQWYDPAEKLYLSRLDDGFYVAHTPEMDFYLFGRPDGNGVMRLSRMEDSQQQAIRFEWQHGKLQRMGDDAGHLLLMHYTEVNGQARLSGIEELQGGRGGWLVRYDYDDNGYLASVTDRGGATVRRFAYTDGRMTEHVNATGFVCRYRYAEVNGTQRVVEHSTSRGAAWRFDYAPEGGHTVVTDTRGRARHWYYTSQGNVTRYVDTDGGEYHYEYNGNNWPVAVKGPDGAETRMEYDVLSRPVKVTDTLGRETALEWYGNASLLSRVRLDDGREWRTEYDAHYRVVKRADPENHITGVEYGADGQPVKVTDARGGGSHPDYSTRGELLAYTDCSGKTTRYGYSVDGWLVHITDALGQTTRITHTATGLPQTVTRPDLKSEHYEWNALNRLTRHVQPSGATERWTYTPEGFTASHTDAEGRQERQEYGEYGELLGLINGNGAAYCFAHDAAGRVREERRPDGTARVYHWQHNQLTGITQRGSLGGERHTRYEHDAAGRLTAAISSHSERRYGYNRLDQVTEVVLTPTEAGAAEGVAADRVAFDYDRAGRLTAEQGAQGAIRYRRDALGNPESLTLPDGRKTEWLMYGSGHVQGIRYNGRLVSDITRDGLHREIIRSQGALTQYSGYTRSGQMAWQRIIRGEYAGSGIPSAEESENRKDWRYSADGELIMETGPHGAELYDYDRAGWLRSHAPAQGVQERFHWDKAGNPVNEYETVADNRVRAWGKYRYEYDEWGQVILRGEGHREKTLAWDADGHLLRVISGDRTTHYRYDALGRRTHKVTRTDMQDRVENETHFLWQGTRLLEERTNESRKTYIYGDARSPVPVACAERRAGREEIYHYQTDPSLRIRTVTDETGKVVWDGCWQAWGRMQADLSGPGGFEQNLRLAGQYYDRESGLHYNLFRYYDPDVPGRFLSSDPIGLAGGINLYRYAPNALGWIDPLGLDRFPSWMDTKQGYQRQHIIPYSLREHPIFVESGMSINGASNMMYLPVAEGIDPNPDLGLHKGWTVEHSDYNKMMENELNKLKSIGDQEKWDYRKTQEEIIKLQSETRKGFQSGTYTCA
ncbi:RHS repeat-associated core domain-containing protein [Escherichia sp. MOD1-EC6099]|uniref:RHS repeat-associated core domain-containing protein n=1 Tax=Escherichia sp. MOD1-EC6099 TaxID=2093885 RepID=UPI000CF76EBD|nr:RHS repeat-associated core domain-containing protein [Escherichia sp. MOD1-EC6099]